MFHWHMIPTDYRCSLPGLTGFTVAPLQWIEISTPLILLNQRRKHLTMSLTLLERVAGYRAPLPPHPARPIFPLYCGAEGGRTLDLSIANAALSQLSYGPKNIIEFRSFIERIPKRTENTYKIFLPGKIQILTER